MRDETKRSGFTLIEVALMLAVLGLLLGVGVSLIGPLVKRSKLTETREAVKQATEALAGYAVKNGYLPYQETTYDPLKPAQAFVLAGSKGNDAFGRPLHYVAAPELEWDNATPLGTSPCNTAVRADVCAETETSLALTQDGVLRQNIAFMIVSAGENQNIQTGTIVHGLDFPNVDDFPEDMSRPEPYDDVVTYVALDELRHLRGCQPLEVLSSQALPAADEGQPYTFTLQAHGGVPPYVWVGAPSGGLTLSASGTLSGVVAPGCQTALALSATVCDRTGQSLSWTGTLPVRLKPLSITTVELPVGYENSTYQARLFADGHDPFSWSLSVVPACPLGLVCAGDVLSGTPAAGSTGTYQVTARVTDNCGRTAVKRFGLTIHPASASGGDNGTGGGGGGGGGTSGYALMITNQGTEKSYRIGIGSCVSMRTGYSASYEGLPAATSVAFFSTKDCKEKELILSGTLATLDMNGDLAVRVECSGNQTCTSS